MSLGTKVLLITLAITLGLAGMVIWVVSAAITKHEVERAHETIHAAVTNYFARVDFQRQRVASTVRLLMEDPQQRALLDEAGVDNAEAHTFARAQLHDQIFGSLLQIELTDPDGIAPEFHVLTDARGGIVVVQANRPALEPLLAGVTWVGEGVAAAHGPLDRDVWVGGDLYVVFGVPLRSDFEQPPSHAYFAGYRVDDKTLERILGRVDPTMTGPALSAWMLVDGKVVARAAETPAGSGAVAETVRAMDAQTPATSRTSNRNDRTRIDFHAAGERFVGESFGFTPATDTRAANTRGTFAVVSSLDRALAPLRKLQRNIALVTVVVVIAAVIASRILSMFIAWPVRQLVDGTRRISKGDFATPIPTHRRDELGDLARSFNEMAAGLAQRDVIKDTFGKFVDPSVVEALLRDPDALRRGERRVQTVLFSDLANFTAMSEKLTPEDQVRLLNAHLGDAAEIVAGSNGIVDKFIGDAVMAFWGPPMTGEHARLACRAALWMVDRTHRHAGACRDLGVPPLRVRVGIATGDVVVGVIGSAAKFNYTVMGDVANLSSRLEGINKVYGTSILVSPCTAAAVGDAFLLRPIDTVRAAGRAEATELFEVIAETIAATDEMRSLIERYARARALYQSRDWPAARAAFESFDGDPPSRVMADRCGRFETTPPPPDWDGVWQLSSK